MAETQPSADIVPQDVISAVRKMRAPLLIAHVVPDADALGCMFALARVLGERGIKACVSLPDGVLSQRLTFLFTMAQVRVATPDDFKSADGFVVMDTAKKDRCCVGKLLKETDWSAGRPIVNIDHHETNTRFGEVHWIVPTASSACELVYRLIVALGGKVDATTASLLYAGIQTDTLGFSLPSTTPSSLRAAADLVEIGADVGDLCERLGRSQSKSEFELLRIIYDNTKTAADGRIAYSSASFDEIKGAGCTAADIDDQINVPRSLDGVRLAMLFTEGNAGKTRINFRSSGNVTVTDLAAQFGGGGHAQASGAILSCSLPQAIEQVIPKAVEHIRRFA